jgi:thioredoxin-related protein
VLGAALDRDPELVRRHAREHGYTFPITLDAEPLRQRFGLRRVIPTTVTFDRRGRLLQRIPGEMAEDDVRALARLADAPT